MTEKSIENLPDEVLLQIFELFEATTLKNCCLVNNRWNSIIGSSPSTMKNFTLKISVKEPAKEVFNLKREFYSISIEQSEVIYNGMILEHFGAKIRHLKLKKVFVQSLEKLLKYTPLLESLEFNQVNLITINQKKVSLPNLRHLRIEDSNDEILLSISGTKYLNSLEIITFENREIILNFLKESSSLQSFAIGFKSIASFFQSEDVLSVPFRLKKLDFAGFPMIVTNYEICLLKFLKLHTPTLETLSLPHVVNSDLCQIVFTQIPNLKTLTFNVESLPTEKSFYCCISPLLKVTSLRLVGKFPKHEVAKLFIVNFPNTTSLDLKHLKCSIWSMKFLQKISESQKEIKHLMISNFFKGLSKNLLFRNLKSLFVLNSQNVSMLMNFIRTHSSTIEEITVDRIHEEFKPIDILDILDFPEIRKLSVRSDKKNIEEIWNIIKADYKNLKELNIRIFSIKSCEIEKKIIFPLEKNFWSAEKCDRIVTQLEE